MIPGGIAREEEVSYVPGLGWFGLPGTRVSAQLFQSRVLDASPRLLRDGLESILTLLLRRQLANDMLGAETMWLTDLRRGAGLVVLRRTLARDSVISICY